MRLILALALAFLLTSSAVAEDKAVEIPLKRIWASGMPKTQRDTDLDPEVVREFNKLPKDQHNAAAGEVLAHTLQEKSLVYRFLKSLNEAPRRAKGFAVAGHAAAAMRNIILTPLDSAPDKLPVGDVTLVFFAAKSPDAVHIERVARSGPKIEIHYGLTPNHAFVDGNYFALIPVGKLSPGRYEVAVTSKQQDRPAAKHVSQSFSFMVEQGK